MGHVRTDIRYLLHLGRMTLGLVIGKISKRRVSKKICLGEATQKDCSDGKHSDEFPRHAKARDSAVNCQGTSMKVVDTSSDKR